MGDWSEAPGCSYTPHRSPVVIQGGSGRCCPRRRVLAGVPGPGRGMVQWAEISRPNDSEQLPPGQVTEWAWLVHELIVAARLDDPAFFEDVDAIGLDDGIEPVGDHDPGDPPELVRGGCR